MQNHKSTFFSLLLLAPLTLFLYSCNPGTGTGSGSGTGTGTDGSSSYPVASFTTNLSSGNAPLVVTFDGSSSTDKSGYVVLYKWDFGDGEKYESYLSKVDHTYKNVGTYYPTLTVSNFSNLKNTSSAKTITVTETPAEVSLGTPTLSGSGCPQGSVSATLSPDKKSISLLFDQFIVSAEGVKTDYKNCDIAIPVTVPNGHTVSVYKLDYRGFASVSAGSEAALHVDYFFAGSGGVSLDKKFSSGYESDFTLTQNLQGTSESWSPCGEELVLRAKTTLTAKNSSAAPAKTEITIDSVDMTGSITYHLRYQTCQ